MNNSGLLLRGAFLSGSAALDAWDAWQSETGLDAVDPEAYALLPLLHRRLEALRAGHSELPRLRGVRRRVWLENQLVLREAAEALRCLEDAGIHTLLLGELALVTGYYRDPGLRPIRQIEILVPRRDTARAQLILGAPPPRIALRRQALLFGCPRSVEEAWWNRAVPVQFQNVAARVPGPADQLVHTLISGMRWTGAPATWWMADALVILSDSPVDSARVVEVAGTLRVGYLMRQALDQISAVLGRPVAPDLLDALRGLPGSFADRLEYAYVSRPRRQRPLLSWLVALPRRFQRIRS